MTLDIAAIRARAAERSDRPATETVQADALMLLAEAERLRAALTNVCGECAILVQSDGSATHNADHLTMTIALARIHAAARAALEGGAK